MENLLIVNADDFGLSKGQNYGIIEACRRGVVTSTTALINGEAVEHAAQLSREPTHIDSHHHVHMIPAIFPLVAEFAQRKGVAMRVDREVRGLPDVAVTSTEGFSSAFYGDEIDEALFLKVLDESAAKGERSLEVMAHPAFVDNIVRKSAYCWPRLAELDVLTSASLKYAIAERGYRLGTFRDL